MDEELERLRLRIETGDLQAQYLYNQLLIERGELNFENLRLEDLSKLNDYPSIPILLHILQISAINNYKLMAAIYLINLRATEAIPYFLSDLQKIKPDRLNENIYRNKLIDGLVEFKVEASIPILIRILQDSEEFDDIRGHAAKALVQLDPKQAVSMLLKLWDHASLQLRRSIIAAYRIAGAGGIIYLDALLKSMLSNDETTSHMATSTLIDIALWNSHFGFEKPIGTLTAEELYKTNQPIELEHKIVRAINATGQTRKILDLLAHEWYSLWSILFAAKIIRHFPPKIVQRYRPYIKKYLEKRENLDPGFRYRPDYQIVRAIRIALKLRERDR